MTSDVVGVMDQLRLQKAAVVGWSDGAIVALVMALKVPYRLTRVFAFAANMDPSGVKDDIETNPTFARFERQAADDYAQLSPTPNDYADFQAAIEQMWASEPNYTAGDLATITTPVTIADGDHDEAIKRSHTEYLARSIPGRQAGDPAAGQPLRHAAATGRVQRGSAGVPEGPLVRRQDHVAHQRIDLGLPICGR